MWMIFLLDLLTEPSYNSTLSRIEELRRRKHFLVILEENFDLTLECLQLVFVLLRDIARDPGHISHSALSVDNFVFSIQDSQFG